VDSGQGVFEQSSTSGPMYSFTSTKATARAGNVYWTASFSTAELPECAGQAPQTLTTRVRTLTVVPVPPVPLQEASPVAVEATISVARGFHLRHPVVAYGIHCTVTCSGTTDYEVVILRRHKRASRVSRLGRAPTAFAIGAADAGWQFSERLGASAVHLLKRLLHERDKLAFQLTVSATDLSGEVMHAARTVPLGR
jgi:hypothetical protein